MSVLERCLSYGMSVLRDFTVTVNIQSEMKSYREQLDIEKQQWIENYMKKQETYLLSKEREMKEGVRDARDKEIEMVIARLEQETALSREEAERAADNRIR